MTTPDKPGAVESRCGTCRMVSLGPVCLNSLCEVGTANLRKARAIDAASPDAPRRRRADLVARLVAMEYPHVPGFADCAACDAISFLRTAAADAVPLDALRNLDDATARKIVERAYDAADRPALKTQMAMHCDVAKGILSAAADVLSPADAPTGRSLGARSPMGVAGA